VRQRLVTCVAYSFKNIIKETKPITIISRLCNQCTDTLVNAIGLNYEKVLKNKNPTPAKSLNDIKMQTNANMESYIRTFIEHDININKA